MNDPGTLGEQGGGLIGGDGNDTINGGSGGDDIDDSNNTCNGCATGSGENPPPAPTRTVSTAAAAWTS